MRWPSLDHVLVGMIAVVLIAFACHCFMGAS